MFNTNTLIITNDIKTQLQEIEHINPKIIQPQENIFLLQHAKLAQKEAYISTDTTKYICLCADNFNIEAQNSLLKLLEEPPKNIIFILITTSKNGILPTILSRVSLMYKKKETINYKLNLDVKNLNLKSIYQFLQTNKNISKQELENLIYAILDSFSKNHILLPQDILKLFSQSIKLTKLNSKPISILTNLLYHLKEINANQKNQHK